MSTGFATSLSILISFIAGVVLFGTEVTVPFVVGCSVVLAATWFYNQPETAATLQYDALSYDPMKHALPSSTYTVNIQPAGPENGINGTRRMTQASDAQSDLQYPFTEYSNTLAKPPQFINLSPFTTPLIVTPPVMEDGLISPKSPVPPTLPDSPFVPFGMTTSSGPAFKQS